MQRFKENGHEVQRAVVTPANCTGCGACVGVCPNRAIDVQAWTLAQYEAMVDAIADGHPGARRRLSDEPTRNRDPSRGEMLKRLREAHAASVERAQALFGEQRRMQQAICAFIR